MLMLLQQLRQTCTPVLPNLTAHQEADMQQTKLAKATIGAFALDQRRSNCHLHCLSQQQTLLCSQPAFQTQCMVTNAMNDRCRAALAPGFCFVNDVLVGIIILLVTLLASHVSRAICRPAQALHWLQNKQNICSCNILIATSTHMQLLAM